MDNDYDSAMTRTGNVLVVLAMAMAGGALVGCSDSDAAPAPTSGADTVATTTDPPVTSAPTTSAPTTSAPTTIIDPAEALAAEVEADFLEADRLGRVASQDPFNADKEQAALDRRVGFSQERLRASLADYRIRNYAIRPNPTTPASTIVEVPATLVLEGSDVAQLQVCEINSWILVEVGAGPAGADAIVNPDVIASRSTIFLRQVGGTWRVEGGEELGRWEGATECPTE